MNKIHEIVKETIMVMYGYKVLHQIRIIEGFYVQKQGKKFSKELKKIRTILKILYMKQPRIINV